MGSILLERGAQPVETLVAVGGPQAKFGPELVEVVQPARLQVSKSPFTQAIEGFGQKMAINKAGRHRRNAAMIPRKIRCENLAEV